MGVQLRCWRGIPAGNGGRGPSTLTSAKGGSTKAPDDPAGSPVEASLVGQGIDEEAPRRLASFPDGYVLEIDTISRRAPMPSTIVAVWSSEILAKANRESTVTGIPSLSMMPKTRTGVLNDVSRGWPGASCWSLARNFSRASWS